MKRKKSFLSAEELEALKDLEADLRGYRNRWRQLVAELEQERATAVRAEVHDRLLCVLHDCIAPALDYLESITASARERNQAKERADAKRPAAGRARRRATDA